MKFKINKVNVFLVIAAFIFPVIINAQPYDPPPDFEPQVYDVPFDNGVVVLVAIAVVYGLLKIRAEKRKSRMQETV